MIKLFSLKQQQEKSKAGAAANGKKTAAELRAQKGQKQKGTRKKESKATNKQPH